VINGYFYFLQPFILFYIYLKWEGEKGNYTKVKYKGDRVVKNGSNK
jgi:TRAP-type mannitol/chloroaromatic compound transport system permease small subunit